MAKEKQKSVAFTMDESTVQRLKYWSEKKGLSQKRYIQNAIALQIAFDNQDMQMPDVMAMRINQIVSALQNVESRLALVEKNIDAQTTTLTTLLVGNEQESEGSMDE